MCCIMCVCCVVCVVLCVCCVVCVYCVCVVLCVCVLCCVYRVESELPVTFTLRLHRQVHFGNTVGVMVA